MNVPESRAFNPFPGLRPFQMDEEYLFFGRDAQRQELLELLREHRFVAVLGASGGGKSSLVRAGLMPALHGGYLLGAGSHWNFAVLRPGGNPIRALAVALIESGVWEEQPEPEVLELETALGRSGLGLVDAVRHARLPATQNLLVVVDQFEELFRFQQSQSESSTRDESAAFVSLLIEATRQTTVPIYVVLTMRSDFFGDCAQFEDLAEAVNQGEYLVPRMNRDQRKQAIEGPIRVGGGRISARLLQQLLQDVGDDPDQLPILQHALMRTWDHWSRTDNGNGELDLDHYEAIGGMREALSRHADEIYLGLLSDEHRRIAERLLKALTERGKDNRGIRRPIRFDNLVGICNAGRQRVTEVVEAFRASGCTFLMPGPSVELTPGAIIDIAHESLMRVWKRLVEWVEEESESARIYRRIADTATLWKQGRASFYRDPDLQLALSWRNETDPNPAWAALYGGRFTEAMEFLEASRLDQEAEQKALEAARQHELEQARALAEAQRERAEQQARASHRLRWMVRGLGVLVLVAIALSVFAGIARRDAQKNAALAQANALSAQTNAQRLRISLARSDYNTAVDLLEKGINDRALNHLARAIRSDSNQWPAAFRLVDALSQTHHVGEPVWSYGSNQPMRYAMNQARFGLVTVLGNDGTFRGLDEKTGAEKWRITGIHSNSSPVAWLDGRYMAHLLTNQTFAIVDFQTGQLSAVNPGPSTRLIQLILWETNRPTLVVQGQSNVVTLWDVASARQVGSSVQIGKDMRGCVGYPDGEGLLIWSDDSLMLVDPRRSPPVVRSFPYKSESSHIMIGSDSSSAAICNFERNEFQFLNLKAPDTSWRTLRFQDRILQLSKAGADDLYVVHTAKSSGAGLTKSNRVRFQVVDIRDGRIVSDFDEPGVAAFDVYGESQIIAIDRESLGRVLRHIKTGELYAEVPDTRTPMQPDQEFLNRGALLSFSKDNRVFCWDINKGDFAFPPIKLSAPKAGYRVSPEQERIAITTTDNKWHLYSLIDGSTLCESPVAEFLPEVTGFSSDGNLLYTSSYSAWLGVSVDGHPSPVTIKVGMFSAWDLRVRSPLSKNFPLRQHSWFSSIGAGGEQLQLITPVSPNGEAGQIYDLVSGNELSHDFVSDRLSVFFDDRRGAAYSSDSRRFAYSSAIPKLREANNGRLIAELSAASNAFHVGFSPDSSKLLVAHERNGRYHISTFDSRTGAWLSTTDPMPQSIDCAIFSPDSSNIFAAFADGSVASSEAISGRTTWTVSSETNRILRLTSSADGKYLLAATVTTPCFVIATIKGEVAGRIPSQGLARSCAFSPDAKRVAIQMTVNDQSKCQIWESESGLFLGTSPNFAYNMLSSIAFSQDGNLLVVSGRDQILLLNGKDASLLKQINVEGETSHSLFQLEHSRVISVGTFEAKVLHVAPHQSNVPAWVPLLADLATRSRLNDEDGFEPVADGLIKEVRRSVASTSTGNPYRLWADWYFDNPAERGMFPGFRPGLDAKLRDLLADEFRKESLRLALLLSPTNGNAYTLLAHRAFEDSQQRRAEGKSFHRSEPVFWYSRRIPK
jgi:WD40 repeat protein